MVQKFSTKEYQSPVVNIESYNNPNCCDDDSVCNANYVHNLNEKFRQFYLNKMKTIESELLQYKTSNESYRTQLESYRIKVEHLTSQCKSYQLTNESSGKYQQYYNTEKHKNEILL